MPSGRALTTAEIAQIRELRYEDGLTSAETARRLGLGMCTVYRYASGRPGKIPVDALRDAFEGAGVTASEVARRLGWWSGREPDASRVLRTVGLRDDRDGGRPRKRRLVDAETVGRIAEAIGRMPWEVGA